MHFLALIIASATVYSSSLAHGSSRRTEGSREDLDRGQDRSKHRPWFLTKKPFRRGRPVRTCEEKVVHSGEECMHPWLVESAQWMVPQREVAIAPFDIGTGALEHLRERSRFSLQPVLFNRMQRTQCPTGHKQGLQA